MPPLRNKRLAVDTAIVSLIASGRATTRADIAQTMGWSPSTVSVRIQQLIDDGLIEQRLDAKAGGRGRPAVGLALTKDGGFVAVIGLGGHHAQLALMSLSGVIKARDEISVDLGDGPDSVLEGCVQRLETMAAAGSGLRGLQGIGLATPGPVDAVHGVVTMPARMPGWSGFAARDWLGERMSVPAVVENDANVMAYAEQIVRQVGGTPTVTVKAGTGIGAGIIVDGAIYRGATFAAGDITHYRVAAGGDTPCSCGNRGCLETVASGAALVSGLRAQGVEVASTRDVVRLAHESDPAVTTAVRSAGANLGQVLCAVVNFFNPSAIYLGGLLPTVDPFVAAVRAEIYSGSHPLVTHALTVERTQADADGVLIGCGHLIIEECLGSTITTLRKDSNEPSI